VSEVDPKPCEHRILSRWRHCLAPHLLGGYPVDSLEDRHGGDRKHASQTSFWRASRRCRKGAGMEVLYPRCAGLDLAKDSLVACVRIHGRPV
jgi:hypothetical protein